MLDLMRAMKEYERIPETFDGEIPQYAFGEIKEPRLKVGNKYLVPDESGHEVAGILEHACVLENERKVWAVYRLDNGKQVICTCPLSDKELEAFLEHPDTFFGVHKKHKSEARDPLDLFDFFHSVYSKTSKEKLLAFMERHHDYQKLKSESQEELAITYCERLVYEAIRREGNSIRDKGAVKDE